jgi:apolipoprotein N-acyltransferase
LASALPTRVGANLRAGWRGAIRRRYLAAFGFGGLAALALPPLGFLPGLLGFAGLVHLLQGAERRRQAALLGWCFGFGHFVAGLYWIAIAFFADAERFGALAVPAVLLLCAYLALYPALAGLLAGLRRWHQPSVAALALALAWTLGEWLRANVLWGFPWNLVGYAWIELLPVAQLAALTGVYGLSLLAVLAGGLPATLLTDQPGRWRAPLAGVVLVALIAAGGAWRLAGAEPDFVEGATLRLVQGNVAQHHKWDPARRAEWFERHLSLSADPSGRATVVIWPESATPYQLETDAEARRYIAEAVPPGGLVITGGERFDLESDPPRAWNSLFALDQAGAIRARYDKHQLVPFGEFLPWRSVLAALGLEKVTAGTFDFLPGPGPQTLDLPGLPPVSPLICYEVIFTGAVLDPAARPAWLLNITNDAWFGRSSGPYQHLAMARLRTIEEGLPLVRSANTGISAVIDPWGRVLERLPLNQTGTLESGLPQPLAAPPPYARLGLAAVLLVALGLIVVILLIEKPLKKKSLRFNKLI